MILLWKVTSDFDDIYMNKDIIFDVDKYLWTNKRTVGHMIQNMLDHITAHPIL